ncbi:kinase-like protein [Rickenella mellea]|uniref:Kinase-like protein n=1 Tax=Rickenella mellea TaxID=50990 RepID=A0A4Y7Q5N3_9AGAM|nr:kinase-like protein [Rickenella mellea]
MTDKSELPDGISPSATGNSRGKTKGVQFNDPVDSTFYDDATTQGAKWTSIKADLRVTFDLPDDESPDGGTTCSDTRGKILMNLNEQHIRPVDDVLWQVLSGRLKIYPVRHIKNSEVLKGQESLYQPFWQKALDWMKKDTVGVLVDHDEIYRSIVEMVNHLKAVERNFTVESHPWSEITIHSFLRDYDDLEAFAEQTIRSVDLRERIYSLDPSSFRRFLSVLQMLSNDTCTRKRVFERYIKKFVAKTGILPQNLFVEGVSKIGENPLVGGGFADVYKGYFQGRFVALKVLRVFERGKTDYDALRRSFCRETILWQKFDNANVLPFYGICEDIFRPKLAMVSPWMENGDMIKYLKHNPGVDRRNLVLGVAEGLQYLHSFKPTVVHGDLRAANVVIDDDGQPRIADFGLTKVIDSQASLLLDNSTSLDGGGNVRWHSPEVLHPSRFNLQHCGVTKESDIYAFACVCLEIFTGKIPFWNLVDSAVVMEVGVNDKRPPRPSEPATRMGLDDHMWAVMETCWITQPGDRMTISKVVEQISDLNATYEAPNVSSMTVPTGTMHDAIDDPDWAILLVRGVRRTGEVPVTGGGFADIWRGEFRGKHVALKVIRTFGGNFHEMFSMIKFEALTMLRVNHVNVLPFYGVCNDEFQPNVALITPWMENGDLLRYLTHNIDANRLSLACEVLSGLSYLHGLKPKIVHGDLKAANVLVDSNFRPRLSDFGLSKFYDSLASLRGTPRWQAPELLSPDTVGVNVGKTTASDIYAFACLCLEVFTGKPPFRELSSDTQVLMTVVKGGRPKRPPQHSGSSAGIDDTVWKIITHCWAQNRENRPSAEKVFRALEMHESLLRTQAELKEMFI